MASKRKTPQTWIDAGLAALKSKGPDGVRAETLARDLGATKGSFYWHFKDVPAFHDEVLKAWSAQIQARFEKALGSGDTPVMQLRALAKFRQTPLDSAVRAWAAQDSRAQSAVTRVDKAMLSQISDLLTELDATHPDFPGLIHAALIAAPKKGSHAETLIDLLLVLK
ncbi:TetR/AcrR family transcriptional regulator [Aliishimia ponticola]|uniref:TetR/AcrR family transcriptional regulator n=1 Tax=Aliishimia ponticola TaxID=2499833 RepID=A0A4S4N8Z6_9RHOB|nr:TetR/AcrR family transcriptional regulator [Aliishimia ponticola]THH35045.1 TetR/AcrR family transcriptional regulator [Aliishimia ponticola]